jgi:hypothetical protein
MNLWGSTGSGDEGMPLISKIYVWSLVLESLIFFQLETQATMGVSLNPGRVLQLFVLLCVLSSGAKLFLTKSNRISSSTDGNFILFLIIAFIGVIYGFTSGAYQVPNRPLDLDWSMLSDTINFPYVRPLVEYFIYFYYFIYFILMPRYFLNNEKAIKYFFRIFSAVFAASFMVGWGDIVMQAAGTDLYLPREVFSDRHVGMRFHGFAGEPRDAFVYLFLGLALLHLRELVTGQKLSKLWIGGIIAAALMTQSASGLIGVIFFTLLYGTTRFFNSFTLSKFIVTAIWGVTIILLFYVAVIMSPRIQAYLDVLASAYETLLEQKAVPPLLAVQINNIFPIYQFVINIFELNWVPVLIGSGLGSSSSTNLILSEKFGLDIWGEGEVINPNSQLVRLVFETGLIGTTVFYWALITPIKRLARPLGKSNVNQFVTLTLLVLGCCFAHRSTTIFIYLGIFVAVMASPFVRSSRVAESVFEPNSPIASPPERM